MRANSSFSLISIITPSFNQGEFLQQTIRSVVEQDYPNIEYLIMDGGSTDKSVEIIKKYAKKYPKIINWQSKKDGGQVDAINLGLKKATGEIVAYINSDDYYFPGAFEVVAREFDAQPTKMWLTGMYKVDNKSNRLFGKVMQSYVNFWTKRYSYSLLLVLNCIAQPATFWRKSAALEAGLFDDGIKLAFDYDYWLKLGKISDPIVVDSPLATFRVHKKSKGYTHFVSQFREEIASADKNSKNILLKLLHRLHVYVLVIPGYYVNKL